MHCFIECSELSAALNSFSVIRGVTKANSPAGSP